MNKPKALSILAVATILIVVAVFLIPETEVRETPAEDVAASQVVEPAESAGLRAGAVEDVSMAVSRNEVERLEIDDALRPRLLRNYGRADQTVGDDLRLVDDVLQRFWLMFKDPDLLQVGSNEDFMKSLLGKNPRGIEFVSPENPYIDSRGRLLDRWGGPLFFHANSLVDIDIRSSGPDGKLFTEDDVQVRSKSGLRYKR